MSKSIESKGRLYAKRSSVTANLHHKQSWCDQFKIHDWIFVNHKTETKFEYCI